MSSSQNAATSSPVISSALLPFAAASSKNSSRAAAEDGGLVELVDQLKSRLGAAEVAAARTPNVAFFLVPQPHHANLLMARVSRIGDKWGEQVRIERF